MPDPTKTPILSTTSSSVLETLGSVFNFLSPAQTREIFRLVAERKYSPVRRIYLGACQSVTSVSEDLRERVKTNSLVSLKYYWQTS